MHPLECGIAGITCEISAVNKMTARKLLLTSFLPFSSSNGLNTSITLQLRFSAIFDGRDEFNFPPHHLLISSPFLTYDGFCWFVARGEKQSVTC